VALDSQETSQSPPTLEREAGLKTGWPMLPLRDGNPVIAVNNPQCAYRLRYMKEGIITNSGHIVFLYIGSFSTVWLIKFSKKKLASEEIFKYDCIVFGQFASDIIICHCDPGGGNLEAVTRSPLSWRQGWDARPAEGSAGSRPEPAPLDRAGPLTGRAPRTTFGRASSKAEP
jgi:hypothetical protein